MISRRSFLTMSSGLALLPWCRPARASTAETLTAIVAARRKVRTLRAPFEQVRSLGLLSAAVRSEGELTLVRPDRLRWEIKSPEAIIYWLTPAGVFYESSRSRGFAEHATAGALGAVLKDLLVMLSGDLTQLAPRHDLVVSRQTDGSVLLQATPKNPDVAKLVRRVTVSLAADLITPLEVQLDETATDKIVVHFRAVHINDLVEQQRMRPVF